MRGKETERGAEGADVRLPERFLDRILRVVFVGRLLGAAATVVAMDLVSGVADHQRRRLLVLCGVLVAYDLLFLGLSSVIRRLDWRVLMNAIGDAVFLIAVYDLVPSIRTVALFGAMFFSAAYAVIGGLWVAIPFAILTIATVSGIEAAEPVPTPGITPYTIVMFGVVLALQASVFEVLVRQRREWRRDVEVMADSIETIAETAFTDSLTMTANRHGLDEFLERLAQPPAAGGSRRPITVLMIDVDRLKEINDEFGHLVGDQVLAMAAECIRQHLRPEDLVARWGGDEFIAVLPGVDATTGERIGERIAAALRESPVLLPTGSMLEATVSIGVASTSGVQFETTIEQADRALRAAKRDGRDGVRLSRER